MTSAQWEIAFQIFVLGCVGGMLSELRTGAMRLPRLIQDETGYSLDLGVIGKMMIGGTVAVFVWLLNAERAVQLEYGLAIVSGLSGIYIVNNVIERNALENDNKRLRQEVNLYRQQAKSFAEQRDQLLGDIERIFGVQNDE